MNYIQMLLVLVALLGATAGSAAQLTDLFGATTAHTIVSAASFLTTIITAVMTPLTGNVNMLKTTAALPGVKVQVSAAQATPAIAAVAVDPDQPNVGGATAEDQVRLKQIAKG